MANVTGIIEIFPGDTTVIDTVAQFPMLQRARGTDGNEYIYLTGAASTVLGSWVTYDEAGLTTLLAANAVGPIAVAMAVLSSTSYYGWYCIFGSVNAMLAANCADNAHLGFETTAGYAGDGYAAGDTIYGAVSRGSTSGAAAITACQLAYPSAADTA